MRRMRAYTLPEMLATLLVLAVLLGWALPSASDSLARTRANGAMMQLRAMLHLARSSAITLRRDVTVCGSSDGRRCSTEWTDMPTMVFVDLDQDRTLDTGESLLAQSGASRAARIRWRASGNRAYLRYKPDGGVKEYGHFLYCPEGGDLRFARQLIVSATGRPRYGRDSNGDGVTDDPNVLAPDCGP